VTKFDLKQRVWVVHGRRTKNGKATCGDLSDLAVQIFKGLPAFEDGAAPVSFPTG
jgi:hypothetical protein